MHRGNGRLAAAAADEGPPQSRTAAARICSTQTTVRQYCTGRCVHLCTMNNYNDVYGKRLPSSDGVLNDYYNGENLVRLNGESIILRAISPCGLSHAHKLNLERAIGH